MNFVARSAGSQFWMHGVGTSNVTFDDGFRFVGSVGVRREISVDLDAGGDFLFEQISLVEKDDEGGGCQELRGAYGLPEEKRVL